MRLAPRNTPGLILVALVGCGQPSATTPGTGGHDGATQEGAVGTSGLAGSGIGGGAGSGGTTGAAGAGGGGIGGAAGSGAISCTISATSTFSTAMPNVAVVTWSTSLANPTKAEIDFGPATGETTMVAPVDLTQASYRTLLLGMKGGTSYVYRIVASGAAGSCTSDSYTIMTGAVPTSAPAVTATIVDASAHDRGFIVTSSGITGATTFIIDADGTVVWTANGPKLTSRAHMSWNGTQMYMMALNVQNASLGDIQTIAMDGTGITSLPGFTASHHDLTAIPGGFATLLWNTSVKDAPCSLVERADATGALTTVVADMGTVYNSASFHTNSVHYYPSDDTYTVGDRNPSLYVKLTRDGQLIWQFGGVNPKDPSKFFTGLPTWSVNHGHQLLSDGTFVFFNNGANEAWSFALDATIMTATEILGYTAAAATSNVLGDVQRLPNGNYLVTFSTSGVIQEISPQGALVATFSSNSFGYAEFRESLYGPPPY
jgi:hypothetical protein